MYKKLVGVGNSMALTIERPIRDLLGIDKDTVLAVTTDGQRLIVEPMRERGPVGRREAEPAVVDPVLELRSKAPATYFRLWDSHGLSGERLKRFHHSHDRPMRYFVWLRENAMKTNDPLELAAMRRNERCLAELKSGRLIEDAMAIALTEEPLTTTGQG